MSRQREISDYTETEFLAFVHKIWSADGETEEDDNRLVREFKRITEHPDGSDVIFYPRDDQDNSPEGIVQEIKQWRAKNGKPGFKPG